MLGLSNNVDYSYPISYAIYNKNVFCLQRYSIFFIISLCDDFSSCEYKKYFERYRHITPSHQKYFIRILRTSLCLAIIILICIIVSGTQ
jgi:hypothetical protein